MADDRKREQVLPPGTYAYILDGTKGQVRIHVGPIVINQTNQDTPVVFNHRTHRFEPTTLEGSVQQNVVVPEGFYAVLTNPAKTRDGSDLHPDPGRLQDPPDLLIGQKENAPGPVNFALFPGQSCEVRRGHHLRSNEYLRIKVYNEDKARENWSRAVVKSADGESVTNAVPQDLAMGKHYNVLGTEVSFYIPPTGVSVVPDTEATQGAERGFVRSAVTLEQLEYAILVDEDGNKEYPRGPRVVFPRPTQRFVVDGQGRRKFRAIEMNELQGIQLKFSADVRLAFVDGTSHSFKAGEEVFVTGKEMPIYFPEEGHQIVRYDGKSIHYAMAIPEGEARYVMNRKTGAIHTVVGPCMLLPNPVTEIIVRRALSDGESIVMFPGADGTGSKEALAYNRWLREQSAHEPSTRQGVVSEARIEQQSKKSDVADDVAPVQQARHRGQASGLPESRQGRSEALAETAERSSSFNEPRMITFANRNKGVPTIRLQPGYAVNVVNPDGSRRVVLGPSTLLLEFGQTLDVLTLSTGKPKTEAKLLRTAYLNVHNNRISDVIVVETSDHVQVEVRLTYNVTFEPPSDRWFHLENYVRHLCDHVRSIVKGKVRRIRIEDFYESSTDLLRTMVLGEHKEGQGRPGLAFPQNGMRITDAEVLSVEVADPSIGQLLARAQHQVVQENIRLKQEQKRIEVLEKTEELRRAEALAKFLSEKRIAELSVLEVEEQLKVGLARLASEITQADKRREAELAAQVILDLSHERVLGRDRASRDQAEAFAKAAQARELEGVTRRAEAAIAQLHAITPHLVEALQAAGAQETLAKVAHSLSFHAMFGASNGADFLKRVFDGTPLALLMDRALTRAARGAEGPSDAE